MGEPHSPSGRAIGPSRAFEAYGTPICPQDTISRTKGILPKVIVLSFDGQTRSGSRSTCGAFAMLPSLNPAFFGCRRARRDPSGVGVVGVDGRVVLRLSPASISRVLLVPTA